MAQQPKKKAGAVLDAQLGRYATDQGLHSSASESLDVQAQLRAALAANSVRVMDLFTEWDENRDGVIDKKEFRKAVTSLGVQAPRLHVDALFDSFDTAGSGAIDYKELNKILRRSAKKHAAVAVPGSVQPGVAGKSELARTVSAADAQAAARSPSPTEYAGSPPQMKRMQTKESTAAAGERTLVRRRHVTPRCSSRARRVLWLRGRQAAPPPPHHLLRRCRSCRRCSRRTRCA